MFQANLNMETLQAQVEAQGAKIRTMKEAMKADAASHTKEQLENEVKELTSLKVLLHCLHISFCLIKFFVRFRMI